MSETPEAYEALDLSKNAPKSCPWKNAIIPGPVAGTTTFRNVPCNRDQCELWRSIDDQCSLRSLPTEISTATVALAATAHILRTLIAPALGDIHAAICKLATWIPKTPSP